MSNTPGMPGKNFLTLYWALILRLFLVLLRQVGSETFEAPFARSIRGFHMTSHGGRRGGLMVSVLDSGASGPGSSPGRGHCVVFLGRTLNSHGASLHPGV